MYIHAFHTHAYTWIPIRPYNVTFVMFSGLTIYTEQSVGVLFPGADPSPTPPLSPVS